MENKTILFASNNIGKIKEVNSILKDYQIYSLKDIGYNKEIDEYGHTFSINSLIKVEALKSRFKNQIIIADDSGLCVDALGGEPGVYSKRFMGENATDDMLNNEIIKRLKDISEIEHRKACLVATYAIYLPSGKINIVEGKVSGYISFEPKGNNGFAYDKILVIEEYNKTLAELGYEIKNKIGHRALALKKVQDEINSYLESI